MQQENTARRAEVHRRAKILDEKRLGTKADNLEYWDRYRQMKVDLVQGYVRGMKLRKRIVEYVALRIASKAARRVQLHLSILQR